MIRSERIGKGRLKFYRDIEIKEKYYGGEISGRRIHVANNVPLSIQLTNRVRGTFRFSMLRKLSPSLESGRFRTKKNSQYQILHNGQCMPQLSQLFNSLENRITLNRTITSNKPLVYLLKPKSLVWFLTNKFQLNLDEAVNYSAMVTQFSHERVRNGTKRRFLSAGRKGNNFACQNRSELD